MRRQVRHAASRSGRAVARSAVRVVVGLSVVLAAMIAASPAAAASDAPPGTIGVRLIGDPSGSAKDPRARLYIVDHVNPGTTIHRRIEVANGTASVARVALYAAAASISRGAFVGAAAREPNDLSSWTSVDPGASGVPASGQITADVIISVPSDAASGERYAAVWAETRLAPPAGDAGVTIVNRVGIRIYLSVGPGGAPAADFAIDSLSAARTTDGRPAVLATVRNTGGRALDMFGVLKLRSGPGGLNAGPYPALLGTTIAIGDTEIVTIRLDKRVPRGPWRAEITLHSGLLERTSHATITFPRTGASPPVDATPMTPIWLPFVVAGLAVLLVIGYLLAERYRRRREAPISEVAANLGG